MGLWVDAGRPAPLHIEGILYRLVESQEQIATASLVDSSDEQELLEQMLDTSKPPYRHGTEQLDYLLSTPFRYPPLQHGSRFGKRTEPSIFYGALSQRTALTESAYYRLVFWHGMVEPPDRPLLTLHTLFTAAYSSDLGFQLQNPPWTPFRAILTDPRDYVPTQALGAEMREAGIEAFEYVSARCPNQGLNVGLFSPSALDSGSRSIIQQLACRTTGERVELSGKGTNFMHGTFLFEQFVINGILPTPAV